jgi:hypothetical protein
LLRDVSKRPPQVLIYLVSDISFEITFEQYFSKPMIDFLDSLDYSYKEETENVWGFNVALLTKFQK